MAIEQVTEALEILFSTSSAVTSVSRREANLWLQQFQKQPTAWSLSDSLIRTAQRPDYKVFAAQTFRQKIEYDLVDLDESAKEQLRNSIIELLSMNRQHKAVTTQLNIALADLAIQMPGWENPIIYLINTFESDLDMKKVVLEFLRLLPEELMYNSKIHLEAAEFETCKQTILMKNSQTVLQVLFGELQNSGGSDNHALILGCLASWIRAGCISSEMIQANSIVPLAFQALKSSDAFEVAVEMICEIIIVSAKAPRSEGLILSIFPYFAGLLSLLRENIHDSDYVRGLCQIFVEAGEGFVDLLVSNFEMSKAILEGLIVCVSNEDLDIVKITINTWFILTERLLDSQNEVAKKQLMPVYESLVNIIIKQMQYPEDESSFTAQDRDDFRDLRHEIGDVLKDCVKVLGQDAALKIPHEYLYQLFHANSGKTVDQLRWQEIEAPLFSLRAMCRVISNEESKYLPEIMGLLPQLPPHPKIQYAAILVIGRYAEWTNLHPEMINYQLDFVTKGFSISRETSVAAAHALRDLCKYCSKHMLLYLDQLHSFYTQTIPNLQERDQRDMSIAVSHLISAVGYEKLSQAIGLFCVPVATRLHTLLESNIAVKDPEVIKKINLTIDELGNMLRYVEIQVPTGQIHPTVLFVQQLWGVIETIFTNFGTSDYCAETICRFLRYILDSTDLNFYPILSATLNCLVDVFQRTKLSCYIWTCAKIIKVFGSHSQSQEHIGKMMEGITHPVFQIIQSGGAGMEEPELVIEEYHFLLSVFVEGSPNLFFSSNLLQSSFQCAVFCLASDLNFNVASVLRYIIDVLEVANMTSLPGAKSSITELLELNGKQLFNNLFHGLIYLFPRSREVVGDVGEIIHLSTSIIGSAQTLPIINEIVQNFPVNEMSLELKANFMTKMNLYGAIN